MSTRIQEKGFPFTYDGWDDAGGNYGDILFYKVEFTEDFGSIKKGETFDGVMIEHNNARLIA